MGLYLEQTVLSERARTTAGVLYVVGTLILPDGFLAAALMPKNGGPGILFLTVPLGGVLVAVSFIMMAFGMLRKPQE